MSEEEIDSKMWEVRNQILTHLQGVNSNSGHKNYKRDWRYAADWTNDLAKELKDLVEKLPDYKEPEF